MDPVATYAHDDSPPSVGRPTVPNSMAMLQDNTLIKHNSQGTVTKVVLHAHARS